MSITIKQAYVAASPDDGYRVLVDRLWPRGISKAAARIDLWLRDIGPTTALRTWYGHEPERWPGFQERYRRELADHGDLLDLLQDLDRQHGRLTLVFGTRQQERNEAEVIAEVLAARPAHGHK